VIDEATAAKVLDFIANSDQPVHSVEISLRLGINRVTISKYLSVLQSRGLVSYRNVGMDKGLDTC
jgi:DNA-binding IclR family transcriptional regulator